MPNWCNNNIVIKGPKNKLKDLSKAAKDGSLFNFMYPRAEELDITAGYLGNGDEQKELEAKQQANLKKFGYKDWYDWSVAEWGTKWDIGECYQNEIRNNELHLAFDTAWSPPLGVYERYISHNDDISISAYYYEPGCDFMGLWEDGSDDCYQLSDVTDKELETDLSNFDDLYGILESRYQYRDECLEDGRYDDAKEWLMSQGAMSEDEAQDYINDYIIEHGLQKQEEEAHA